MADDSSDWRRLNAYADAELPEREARAFEQLLAETPELRVDLERLHDLKQRLARLYPSPAEPAPRPPVPQVKKTE
jgi:anti-sigma factor RsiW